MKLKNANKVAAAQELLTFVKTTGFEDAYLVFCDEEGTYFESVDDVAKETFPGEVTVGIHLILDEELSFLVEGDEETDEEPKITFVS